jgi:hypothetical protein
MVEIREKTSQRMRTGVGDEVTSETQAMQSTAVRTLHEI